MSYALVGCSSCAIIAVLLLAALAATMRGALAGCTFCARLTVLLLAALAATMSFALAGCTFCARLTVLLLAALAATMSFATTATLLEHLKTLLAAKLPLLPWPLSCCFRRGCYNTAGRSGLHRDLWGGC